MLSASSFLAGCGSSHVHQTEPRLPKNDAAQLIALAQTVATENDACAKRNDIGALSARAHQLVADGSVPLRLRAPLLRGIDDLAAAAPACAPPPAPPAHDKGHEKRHGHGNGNDGGD